jgi:hypothetical protein
MLLQLKIETAYSVGEHFQHIMLKQYVWETGKEMSYFILLSPGIRNCVCRDMGEAISIRSVTLKLAFSPKKFSVLFVVTE